MKQPIDRDYREPDHHWRRTPDHVSYPVSTDPRQTELPLKHLRRNKGAFQWPPPFDQDSDTTH